MEVVHIFKFFGKVVIALNGDYFIHAYANAIIVYKCKLNV